MIRARLPLIGLLALAQAGCALAPRPQAERGLWIGPLHLCRDAVADAVVEADTVGMPLLTLTLKPELHDWLRRKTESRVGRRLPLRPGGRLVSEPIVREPLTGGAIQLSGASGKEVEAMRKAALGPC